MSETVATETRATEPEVLVERRGSLGLLTLNRPRSINALTHGMVRLITDALHEWAADDAVQTVAITGAGERGLCAGGDVVGLHLDATQGDGSGAAAFWRDECALNAAIARYPKPYVAIQDGIDLGGGVGISAHGSHRIVTERTKIGFPERHASTTHDFAEGIRAQLIDKDRTPHWDPPSHSAVSEADVPNFFTPLRDGELGLASLWAEEKEISA